MELTDQEVATLAEELLTAERRVTAIGPPVERHPTMGVAEAYAIQRHGRMLRERDGAVVIGRKVGLTSAAMQQLLGVTEPDFGYLTETMVLPDGATIDRGTLLAPRVEAEIAFRLSAPLQGAEVDLEEALTAIGEIAPALEVVDSRVIDWRITLADTVADNASSGMAVVGTFQALGETDLAAVAMEMAVEHADGREEREAGTGAAVLGHPAEALAWLARALAPFGEGVAAGEIVIPGAMARAVTISGAASVRASFSGLGEVRATFTHDGQEA